MAAPQAADTGLPPALADATRDESSLRRFLHGLPGVDQVGVEQRAAGLATRSIKKASKLWAIDTAISMVDLTTLEGADTSGKVRSLCAKARRPDPERSEVPKVAAVCVYPDMVEIAAKELQGTGVDIASVATAFPSGRSSIKIKIADTELAVESGATEVDMVIDRGAFLSGQYGRVFDEIVTIKQASGNAHLKVILETGELDHLRQRAPRVLARAAGRRRLHQDLHRQGQPSRHAARHARHAAGRPRLAHPDR